jgi:hypothetical protein
VAATNQAARHAEIARRYSWAAKQRKNGDRNKKPDHARLITLIRMRELERIFQSRYGRFLPDDDSGRDDLNLIAHHIAHLGGDVVAHVRGWAKAWAPWLLDTEAVVLAKRVALDPAKFTADILAWRLRLSMAERTALGITTIGSFDMPKAERAEERRRKNNEAKRLKRAESSTGRPRGRPRKTGTKNAGTAVKAFAVPAISDQVISPTPASSEPVVTTTTAKVVVTSFPPQIGWSVDEDAVLVGNSIRLRRSFRTRYPTAMRLNKAMRTFAIEAGFTPDQTNLMFEIFREHNIAQRTYSIDWTDAWFNWVEREVEIVNDHYERQRRWAYYAREVWA